MCDICEIVSLSTREDIYLHFKDIMAIYTCTCIYTGLSTRHKLLKRYIHMMCLIWVSLKKPINLRLSKASMS